MLSTIVDIFFIFLAVLGLVDLIRIIICKLFKNKGDKELIILVPIRGGKEDAEIMLRSAATKAQWVYSGSIEKVICLNCGVDEETKKICINICNDYPFMQYRESI